MTTKIRTIDGERARQTRGRRELSRCWIPVGMLIVALILIGELIFVLSDFIPLLGKLISS